MNVLAGILGVLALVGVSALTGFFLWRWEVRDIEREEAMRHAQLQLTVAHYLPPCALRGHKYTLQVDGWLCPVCGDLVCTDDEGGVA